MSDAICLHVNKTDEALTQKILNLLDIISHRVIAIDLLVALENNNRHIYKVRRNNFGIFIGVDNTL